MALCRAALVYRLLSSPHSELNVRSARGQTIKADLESSIAEQTQLFWNNINPSAFNLVIRRGIDSLQMAEGSSGGFFGSTAAKLLFTANEVPKKPHIFTGITGAVSVTVFTSAVTAALKWSRASEHRLQRSHRHAARQIIHGGVFSSSAVSLDAAGRPDRHQQFNASTPTLCPIVTDSVQSSN